MMGKNKKRRQEPDDSMNSSLSLADDFILDKLMPKLLPLITQAVLKVIQPIIDDMVTKLAEKLQQDQRPQPTQTVSISYEEHERRRSFVVANVPESGASGVREKHQEDNCIIKDMLVELGVECDPLCTYRMGQQTQGRPRLIKVMMPATIFQRQVLLNCKNLKNSSLFGNFFVRPSLTKEQRDAEFLLRQECRKKTRTPVVTNSASGVGKLLK